MKKLLLVFFAGIFFLSCNSVPTDKHQKELMRLNKLNSELRTSNIRLQEDISKLQEKNRLLKDGNAELFRKIESLTRELKTLKKETSL